MIKPINPGPLVVKGDGIILSLNPTDGSSKSRLIIAEMFMPNTRPNWSGYAAWLVRASNNHQHYGEALVTVAHIGSGEAQQVALKALRKSDEEAG